MIKSHLLNLNCLNYLTHIIFVRNALDPLNQLILRKRLVQDEVPVEFDVVWHRSVSHLVQGAEAELLEHCPSVVLPGPDVPGGEVNSDGDHLLQLGGHGASQPGQQARGDGLASP